MTVAAKSTRKSMADLDADITLDTARVPARSEPAGRAVRLDRIAPNPLNKRDVYANRAAIASLAASLLEYGQMKAASVVTRAAFVAQFPEFAATVGAVDFVHVDGARRRAAAEQIGKDTLAVTIDDSLVSSRLRFVGATTDENLEREDLNPVEEAEQIALFAAELGTQAAAAEHVRRTKAWVTQRLNLLKLEPELQDALRAGKIPVEKVRDLHRVGRVKQLAVLRRWREAEAAKANSDSAQDRPAPRRQSRAVARAMWLGEDYSATVAAVRAELSAEKVRAMAERARAFADDLVRDLDEG